MKKLLLLLCLCLGSCSIPRGDSVIQRVDKEPNGGCVYHIGSYSIMERDVLSDAYVYSEAVYSTHCDKAVGDTLNF